MRKIQFFMDLRKLFFSFLIISFYFQNSFAQDFDNSGVFAPGKPGHTQEVNLNCNIPRPQTGCNYITNNTFTPSPSYYNDPANINWIYPFNFSLVPEWAASHGSPQIFDGVNILLSDPLPFMGAGYARMGSAYQRPPIGTGGEGIIQKIPSLRVGNHYILSFFKKVDSYQTGSMPDQLKIVFTDCSWSSTFNPDPNNFSTPTLPVPPGSQTVYCEQGFNNANWQQVVVNFTANGNYDMIMIFPEKDPIPQTLGIALFSYPELVNSITAGPSPTPMPGNCVVTIGPTTPNCAVRNAVFTWRRPDGLLIPASTSQQMQVDVSNPINVGNWTLIMTVPGVTITNSNCSQQGPISATVYVPSCSATASWPKIYEAVESEGFKIDNSGNILSLMYLQNMTNNINHTGALTTATGDHYIHYNKTTGVTNWFCNDWFLVYTLNSGVANFYNPPLGNIYKDGATGSLVSGPSNIPGVDMILAEDNGSFITQTGYTAFGTSLTINSYSPSSNIPVSSITTPNIPGYIQTYFTWNSIYNPATHRLFVGHYYWNGAQGYIYRLAIYYLDPITYTLSAVNNPINNPINGPIVQVNNSEKIFVFNVTNQTLEEYNFQTSISTPITINNFVNNSLEELGRSNQIVEDRILIKNTNQHYFYCINTGSFPYTATKISYTPPTPNSQFYNAYAFDGNDVFISGEYSGTGFLIGNQAFPLLGSGSAFITKFNLSEFTSKLTSKNGELEQENPIGDAVPNKENEMKEDNVNNRLGLSLFPNPAKQTLTVTLTQTANKGNSLFFISVTNTAGEKLLTTFSNKYNTVLDVSKLKPGLYYVSITTDNRNIITKAFLKE